MLHKPALIEHDIHPLLRERYSPLAFNAQTLPAGTLRQLMEAARWAASCFNEQPWRFIVAERQHEAEFNALLGCLSEGNQLWAKDASALMITVAKTAFDHNGKPNRHAWHDIGLALGSLTTQAQSLGLWVHHMAGFSVEAARTQYSIPEGFEPVTAVAIGYQGEVAALPESLRGRAQAPRQRLAQAQLVFAGKFGEAAEFEHETAIERVLSSWFGPLDEQGMAGKEAVSRWWRHDPAFDDELREQFGDLHRRLIAGEHGSWLRSARGRLAYVIVLDQFSRNLHRDTAGMYAADERALAVASETIELGLDAGLKTNERVFLYMPFMHAESIEAQDRCVALMTELAASVEGEAKERVSNNVRFAEQHRDIVKQWGRFPHRNAIVGRETTAEEAEFLKQPGSSF